MVKSVFDNFDEFKKLHPALANLNPGEHGQGRPERAAARRCGEVLQGKGLDQVIPVGLASQARCASLHGEVIFAIFFTVSFSRSEAMTTDLEKAPEALQQLVADSDTGGRKPTGITVRRGVRRRHAVGPLFQYWYASPLPFALGLRHPQRHRGARHPPGICVVPGFPGVAGLQALASQPGAGGRLAAGAGGRLLRCLHHAVLCTELVHAARASPTPWTSWWASAGVLLLLEATRRAVGWPMAALALIFLAYCLLGPPSARCPVSQGCVGQPPDFAHVAHHRRRLRHRAGCLGRHHLCVCAVRRACWTALVAATT